MAGISRYRGDTASLGVKIMQDGVPYDLSGCSLIMTISTEQNPDENTPIIQQTSATITDAVSGQASFDFTLGDFDFVGSYYYDVQLTDSNGKTKTVTKSTIRMAQDITK